MISKKKNWAIATLMFCCFSILNYAQQYHQIVDHYEPVSGKEMGIYPNANACSLTALTQIYHIYGFRKIIIAAYTDEYTKARNAGFASDQIYVNLTPQPSQIANQTILQFVTSAIAGLTNQTITLQDGNHVESATQFYFDEPLEGGVTVAELNSIAAAVVGTSAAPTGRHFMVISWGNLIDLGATPHPNIVENYRSVLANVNTTIACDYYRQVLYPTPVANLLPTEAWGYFKSPAYYNIYFTASFIHNMYSSNSALNAGTIGTQKFPLLLSTNNSYSSPKTIWLYCGDINSQQPGNANVGEFCEDACAAGYLTAHYPE